MMGDGWCDALIEGGKGGRAGRRDMRSAEIHRKASVCAPSLNEAI